ncbi:MarR-family transcriptional regulator [Luminiphilus syltensis NOR5-1B]|uniref:MarR-family transcriptional regulator n=1 Tax=Luminiphilus syltensis NOR5-1B TaxID=565045 RepID=B8KT98_9GAMM|nr:MarR family transcriptional regulator [Luminiphilus syltensis]EED36307.1 MarR-family transcriptional regulator [Luminiphilus syltensis NOR5-1B]
MAQPELATLDHESRIAADDHQSIRLWLRLLTCTNLIEKRLRSRLREEFDTTLPRFDFLAQLERASDGLTMGELSARMMVSGGSVSGLATQLESEGLISREPVPENRRTFCVRLTRQGKRRFSEMATQHELWVMEMLGCLNASEVDDLMASLKRLKSCITATEQGA